MDWKDALKGLADSGTLPEGEALASVEETPQKESKKELLHVVVEKKGRGGKIATIIEGFTCDEESLEEIASGLKRKLGVGGSARGGEILIQGNCREKVMEFLRGMGYRVK